MTTTRRKSIRVLGIVMSVLIAISFMPSLGSNTVEAAAKARLAKKKVTLYVGKSYKQKLIVKGKTVKAKKVKWKSKKKRVAVISRKGVIKAKKVGTAKMTAKYKKKSYKFIVVVKSKKIRKKSKSTVPPAIIPTSPTVPISPIVYHNSSISINPTEITINLGETKTVTVKADKGFGIKRSINNDNVSTEWGDWISGTYYSVPLKITGEKKGDSIITVCDSEDKNVKATIKVHVKTIIDIEETSVVLSNPMDEKVMDIKLDKDRTIECETSGKYWYYAEWASKDPVKSSDVVSCVVKELFERTDVKRLYIRGQAPGDSTIDIKDQTTGELLNRIEVHVEEGIKVIPPSLPVQCSRLHWDGSISSTCKINKVDCYTYNYDAMWKEYTLVFKPYGGMIYSDDPSNEKQIIINCRVRDANGEIVNTELGKRELTFSDYAVPGESLDLEPDIDRYKLEPGTYTIELFDYTPQYSFEDD